MRESGEGLLPSKKKRSSNSSSSGLRRQRQQQHQASAAAAVLGCSGGISVSSARDKEGAREKEEGYFCHKILVKGVDRRS